MDVSPNCGVVFKGNDGRTLGAPSHLAIRSGNPPTKAENTSVAH